MKKESAEVDESVTSELKLLFVFKREKQTPRSERSKTRLKRSGCEASEWSWKKNVNAGKGKHDCAKKVEHAEFGEGNCIHGQHAAPDENGNIAWYDVMFEHGVVKGVPITELNVLVSEMHHEHAHHAGLEA